MKKKAIVLIIAVSIAFVFGLIIGNSFFLSSQNKELECLRTYKDIRENLGSKESQLAEREAILERKELVMKYVENDCPNFPDLDLMYEQALKVEP